MGFAEGVMSLAYARQLGLLLAIALAALPGSALTLPPLSQAIDFAPLVNRDLTSPAFAVSATATSGLPVVFTGQTPLVCTVSGTTITLLDAGLCTINANQPGNAGFSPAPQVSRTFLVTNAGAPTPGRLVNLSVRARVLGGVNELLIGGFVVGGPKTVLIRGRGPSL